MIVPVRTWRVPSGRPGLVLAAAVVAGVVLVVALVALLPSTEPAGPADDPSAAPTPATPRTIVSLTFDDGVDSQLHAAALLEERGMRGTFYVVSGLLGRPGHLTLAQVRRLQASGHEIGGHTVDHVVLPRVDRAEKVRQVCDDRRWLRERGLRVRSFAYPYARVDDETARVVAECGYDSARGLGGLRSPRGQGSCTGCPPAESTTPPDPFRTRTVEAVSAAWTQADLQRAVTQAEATGGWTQLTIHRVCAEADCQRDLTPALLEEFLAWLEPRARTHGTVVRPVGDVVARN